MKETKSPVYVIWTLLGFVLGAPVLAYALLLGINAIDERASDDFNALTAPLATNTDPANGYLAFVGMIAPPAQDPISYGARWVSSYSDASNATAIARTGVEFDIGTLKFEGDSAQLCNPSKAACLSQTAAKADGWQQLATDNALLLQRQRQMVASASFDEIYSPPSLESPYPMAYLNRSKLLELNLIAVDATQGRLAKALLALDARLAFDRRALQGSRSMIMGMIATSWLEQDYALLSEILASYPAQLAEHKALLVRMTTPLEVEALRRTAAQMFKGEYRVRLNTFPEEHSDLTMGDVMDPDVKERERVTAKRVMEQLMRPLYKHQASRNLVAGAHSVWLEQLQNFRPENAQMWFSNTVQLQKASLHDKTRTWRIIYNPVGKVILRRDFEVSSQDRYLQRLFALNNLASKVALQVTCVLGSEANPNSVTCQSR